MPSDSQTSRSHLLRILAHCTPFSVTFFSNLIHCLRLAGRGDCRRTTRCSCATPGRPSWRQSSCTATFQTGWRRNIRRCTAALAVLQISSVAVGRSRPLRRQQPQRRLVPARAAPYLLALWLIRVHLPQRLAQRPMEAALPCVLTLLTSRVQALDRDRANLVEHGDNAERYGSARLCERV
jgi:hypothetical protein